MPKFTVQTKKYIAILGFTSYVGLSIYQGIIEKRVPDGLDGVIGLVVGTYFGAGFLSNAKEE